MDKVTGGGAGILLIALLWLVDGRIFNRKHSIIVVDIFFLPIPSVSTCYRGR